MIRKALLAAIRFYQRYISPGLGQNCRFSPTCSQYAAETLHVHPTPKAIVLSAWRILRCNPLCKGGYDPVPEKGRWKNPKRRLRRG